ncbi:MAG: biotin--[acetyl-CoA-carboxylase] ligase [Actinobacteria bacterium RBG_13_35_12]|uniref:Bifunctional ligase/repressor BirA n=1 Tax=Candidatus Sediminicultor quintus TaxID=1797291 RepID=A0A1F5AEH9_9BACT|nr:MAG: biotin--[acetyl-CoA-carboxylase] ligase [Actinobacteria bacterium RBG_13_35_12]OGD16900.1 MAG: biotin--[acetyl-CoA-carboxylase] ligase [Candidatus Atribacteria bacterium RBG_19FT_COMBO_35_14]
MTGNILKFLREKEYISGEALAHKLGISRVAVWKQIQRLKDMGYEIIADQNLGYCLISRPDLLIPQEVRGELFTKYIGKEIYYFPELKSTNIMAKEKALHRAEEINEGTLIIAERQSAGKGRLGREWFSPAGGIWLSIILYPQLPPSYIPRITLMTAVAVVKAIKMCTQIESQIKWPNDILINEKKVCGILTEMSAELDIINWVVVGIGINVNIEHREFPEDIHENTISLKEVLGKVVLRVKLVQIFLQEFEKYYESLKRREFSSILKEWKLYSHTLGRKIRVDMGERIVTGEAVNINEEGALILKKENGELVEIISGTII